MIEIYETKESLETDPSTYRNTDFTKTISKSRKKKSTTK